MTKPLTVENPRYPDPHQSTYAKTVFGFWIYIMTDCILFGMLFATYAVLHNSTFGGPSAKELFSMPFALTETFVLLSSSFTCGLAMLFAHQNKRKALIGWFVITFVLGLSFILMELNEFSHLVKEGHSWQESAFLSSFFTLVGTHGLHVSLGLLAMAFLVIDVARKGITDANYKRLSCLKLFWHFLDVVWVFIFTFVYLMGAL